MDSVIIYTDASCDNKTRKGGGIGYLLSFKGQKIVTLFKCVSEYIEPLEWSLNTTNRFELLAILKALQNLKRFNVRIFLYSDSEWSVRVLNKVYSTAHHMDIIDEIWKIVNKIMAAGGTVDILHVKGHSTNEWNNLVDNLCGAARRQKGGESRVFHNVEDVRIFNIDLKKKRKN